MYAEHFHLKSLPFELLPDTRRFTPLAQYRDALRLVEHSIASGQGVIKVTGEVGLGKTLLCRMLLNRLGTRHALAYLPNPSLDVDGILRSVARELQIWPRRLSERDAILELLHRRLIEYRRAGRRAIIVIDEAQGLCWDALEAIRLLANLETEQHKLLQIVLVGSPELDQRLQAPEARALRQRIAVSYRLNGLSREESVDYVGSRLVAAGLSGSVPFDAAALHRLAEAGKGVPRVLNVLSHKALLAALSRRACCAAVADVDAAIADSVEQVGSGQARRARWRLASRRLWRNGRTLGLGAAAGVAAVLCLHLLEWLP